MGALHDGHYSLIARSLAQSDLTVCSIFVNPTQFDRKEDLAKYPRTLESDTEGLKRHGCHVLYAPSVDEVYPEGQEDAEEVELDGLDTMMEGAHRPGHFKGVVQVVRRLIELTDCDHLYMGQKDYQQFTIIHKMIKQLDMSCALIVCPILREKDGLAMSSRNVRLLPAHRKKASILYRVLIQAQEWLEAQRSPMEISMKALEYLDIPGFRPEYFDLVDGYSLQKVNDPRDHDVVVACTAVWAGEVRLIDNMILKGDLSPQSLGRVDSTV